MNFFAFILPFSAHRKSFPTVYFGTSIPRNQTVPHFRRLTYYTYSIQLHSMNEPGYNSHNNENVQHQEPQNSSLAAPKLRVSPTQKPWLERWTAPMKALLFALAIGFIHPGLTRVSSASASTDKFFASLHKNVNKNQSSHQSGLDINSNNTTRIVKNKSSAKKEIDQDLQNTPFNPKFKFSIIDNMKMVPVYGIIGEDGRAYAEEVDNQRIHTFFFNKEDAYDELRRIRKSYGSRINELPRIQVATVDLKSAFDLVTNWNQKDRIWYRFAPCQDQVKSARKLMQKQRIPNSKSYSGIPLFLIPGLRMQNKWKTTTPLFFDMSDIKIILAKHSNKDDLLKKIAVIDLFDSIELAKKGAFENPILISSMKQTSIEYGKL